MNTCWINEGLARLSPYTFRERMWKIRTSSMAQNSYPLPGKFGLSGLKQVVEVSKGNRPLVIQRGNGLFGLERYVGRFPLGLALEAAAWPDILQLWLVIKLLFLCHSHFSAFFPDPWALVLPVVHNSFRQACSENSPRLLPSLSSCMEIRLW